MNSHSCAQADLEEKGWGISPGPGQDGGAQQGHTI